MAEEGLNIARVKESSYLHLSLNPVFNRDSILSNQRQTASNLVQVRTSWKFCISITFALTLFDAVKVMGESSIFSFA